MQLTRRFDSAAALEAFAAELSLFARPGMVLLLKGDLGTGKSTFARAFIRALAPGAEFDVPSPTFTLVQTYDETRVPVAHADLYRIGSAQELDELGFDELHEHPCARRRMAGEDARRAASPTGCWSSSRAPAAIATR